MQGHPRWMGHSREFWQNVVHWRREWQTTPVYLPDVPAGFRKGSCNAGDTGVVGLIPGSGRSPGVGNGNPLQYSWLENSMGRGAWQATVHGVTKSQTGLSTSSSLPYNVVLVFPAQQSESPLPGISFPFRSPQSMEQSSLCSTVGSH